MLYGFLGTEPVGLKLIDGYHMKIMHLEPLDSRFKSQESRVKSFDMKMKHCLSLTV